jgi:hypothetical protein
VVLFAAGTFCDSLGTLSPELHTTKDDNDPILFTVIGSTGAGIRNGIIPRSEYETRDLLEKRLATERKALNRA